MTHAPTEKKGGRRGSRKGGWSTKKNPGKKKRPKNRNPQKGCEKKGGEKKGGGNIKEKKRKRKKNKELPRFLFVWETPGWG